METRQPKTPLTQKQALEKAAKYCAYQERYHQEVRNKLYDWGMNTEEVENIIVELIGQDFLNEERFARLFTRGKFRMKKWGRVKIKVELKRRKISDYCIRSGMEEIDENDYINALAELMEKKEKSIRDKNEFVRKNKLARYLISKGYESELVWDRLR